MANRIKGITVEIGGDTTKLQTALKGVNSSIRNTQSELRDVEKLLKLDPKNTELLSQKQKLLASAINDTKSKLDTLKTASEQAAKTAGNYDAWKAKYDPIQTEIKETQESLKKLKEQAKTADEQLAKGEISKEKYDALQAEIKDTEDKLKNLETSAQAVNDEFGNPISPRQYDALQREIIETENELRNLQSEAGTSKTALEKIGEAGEKIEKVGDKISGVGQKLLPVTAGITTLGTAAVKTTADFDAAMSKVSAVSGATGDDLSALRAKAREMGASTKYSASEAAEAMNYMAMAGWKTDAMLGGVEGIMHLAAASGEELATTSDIVTDALTALGMTADESGHFADILAAASSNANTNVALMGESFKYCAPVAGSMGASAEDLSIALGLMANSGIKGSKAGSSLKNALVNLVKPTEAQATAMENLGLMTTETTRVFDNDAIEKAQTKVENKTLDLQKAQISYNDAVGKYGESSSQAQKALINIEKAENNLAEAQKELTKEQQGTIETLETGQSAFTDEYGNMKSLGEIMNILRANLGAVNVDLVDSEGNLREYDDIISELSQTEDGLTQAEQLKNAAILFGKQNLSGMLAIINATEEDYNKLTDAIYSCDGTAKSMAETMQDNLEGQLTILKSQLEELAISFGEILMPVIRDIVSKIQSLVDWFNGLDEGTKKTILTVALLVAAIAPVLIVIGKVVSAVGTIMTIIPKLAGVISKVKTAFAALSTTMLANPIVLVIAAITALVAAFIYLWNTNEDFRQFWIDLWENIKEVAIAVWEAIKAFFQATWEAISSTAQAVWNGIKDFFSGFWESIKTVFTTVITAISIFLSTAWNTIKLTAETVWNGIKAFFTGLWEGIKTAFSVSVTAISTFLSTAWNAIKTVAETVWNGIKNFFIAVWDGIKIVINTVVTAIQSFLTTAWNTIKTVITTVINVIKTAISTVFNAIKNVITTVMNGIKNTISTVWNNVKSTVSNVLNGIKSTVSNVFNNILSAIKTSMSNVLNAVKNGFSNVKEHITGLASQAFTWGKDLIMGIVNGIRSCISAVGDAASSVADKIRSFLHFSVPDEGPLTDYESWMPDFIGGLAKSIESSRGMIQKAMGDVASDMILSPTATISANMDAGSSGTGGTSASQNGQISGPLIQIKEMSVRNDDDIRKISQQLYRQLQQGRRANGYV